MKFVWSRIQKNYYYTSIFLLIYHCIFIVHLSPIVDNKSHLPMPPWPPLLRLVKSMSSASNASRPPLPGMQGGGSSHTEGLVGEDLCLLANENESAMHVCAYANFKYFYFFKCIWFFFKLKFVLGKLNTTCLKILKLSEIVWL